MTALRSHARAFARRHAWQNAAPLLMALLLTACATPPTAPTEPEPQAIRARAPSDAKRIEELERQVAELQRQLNDRRRQSLEEKRRLERELKDTQDRLDESQKKLEAILAIDRELRRGNKGSE